MSTDAEKLAIRNVLRPIYNPVIVELGAHLGEDEIWLQSCCTHAPLHIMVEPDIRNVQHIIDHSISRRIIIGAVAAHDGDVTFYGSTDGSVRGSGSIRKPTKHLELFPHISFPDNLRTTVPAYTLDTIFKRERLSKIDLLWVDIQGAERDMIEGGQYALSRTRYLFMETETTELYDGMALKEELLRMLPDWKLVAELDYNSLLRNEGFTE